MIWIRFFVPCSEKIFIIAKENWNPNKKYIYLGDVWRINNIDNVDHPAPFCEELINTIIVSSSNENGLILDCIGGSGTVGKCAIENNRKFILIEKSKKYCCLARERIKKEQSQLRLF